MTKEKLIVVGNDDSVYAIDYNKSKSICEAVKGNFHSFATEYPIVINDKVLYVDAYCEDNFLNRTEHEFDKINVFATYLYKGYIYSNVAICVHLRPEEIDYTSVDYSNQRGFREDEVDEVIQLFKNMIITTAVKEIHAVYDGKKGVLAPPSQNESIIKCTKYNGLRVE